ncbi:MAG TPA: aminoglycoside phosphotransferase family protein [Rhizomicrobium sp.]|jgi:5-methylthioribose kinase
MSQSPDNRWDEADLAAALRAMKLLGPGERYRVEKLGGGVSCDVLAVHVGGRAFCIKRALARLRVAEDWRAPVERAEAEVAWFRLVATIDPRLVPQVLAEDRARHVFAMRYLPPETHPLWKARLAAGEADPDFAARVGAALARIHAATAGSKDIAAQFANYEQFFALRLEPYLLFTATRHEDVAPRIRELAQSIAASRVALMHGDVSPKNILCGPEGPVFLDAETACIGDPAFDLAFCLNHLLLKCVWHPEHSGAYLECFARLKDAYLSGVGWEPREDAERRTAALLPALLLARIDGKSPVEYLTTEHDKDRVRAAAKLLFRENPSQLHSLSAMWSENL